MLLAAVHESGSGPSATSLGEPGMSAFGGDCVAKLDDNPSVRNNRIVAHKFLNQHRASASALESILRVLAPKIVLQHNRGADMNS